VEALASSAVRAADKLRAALLIVFTSTGRTARIIAK
jgi:pyruvate kinase